MTQVCQVTGKKHSIGHTVSHANKKAKRRFNINLHYHRFWLASQKRFITLRVSAKGIRVIDKLGIERVMENMAKYKSDVAGE